MPSITGFRRRGISWISAGAASVVAASLLAAAPPVTASTGAGIVVSAQVVPQDATPHQMVLRATEDMVESDIAVTREGATVILTESEGGPSLGLEAPTSSGVSCVSSSATGPSQEIRCTFSSVTDSRTVRVFADFSSAPTGVTLGSDGSSNISFDITGSAFDDYFEGGPKDDVLRGGAGDDFLIGGSGADRLFGGDGDDVIFGDGEEGDGTSGNDWIEGGPGDDYIDGGPGADSIWGGAGLDDINVKDQVADVVVDCNDNASRGQETEDIVFDIKLDRPFDCGVKEAPQSVTAPVLLGSLVPPLSPGDRLTAIPATWRGATPMSYSYTWEACSLATNGSIRSCDTRGSGSLKGNGKDEKTGKDPQYTVTKADTGRIIRFVSSADNSKIRGGSKESVTSNVSDIIEPGISFTFPPWTMPVKQFMSNILRDQWFFSTVTGDRTNPKRIVEWLGKQPISKHIDISFQGVPRKDVPKQWRRDIRNGDVFDIVVDGSPVTPKSPTVEISRIAKSDVILRYWSYPLDTLDCGKSQDWVKSQDDLIKEVPTELTGFLKTLEDSKCTYELTFEDPRKERSDPILPVSIVRSVRIGSSDPETGLPVLRVTALSPSPGNLSLSVGAPRGSVVASAPNQPSISIHGQIPYFGPGTPFGAVWVALIGDQARQPTVPTRVDIFELSCGEKFRNSNCSADLFSRGQMGGTFSTNLTVPLGHVHRSYDARVRILVTTFHDPAKKKAKDGSLLAREQVYADVLVENCDFTKSYNCRDYSRMTLDGRCFDDRGTLTSCARWELSNPLRVVHSALASKRPRLATMAPADALRYASQVLDESLRPVLVNDIFPLVPVFTYADRRAAMGPRSAACVWWDLVCHIRGIVTRIIDAIVKPKPTPGKRLPAVTYRLGGKVVYLAPGESLVAIGNDLLLEVPGVGLIGLDGASLIGLDGASLIGLDGASLIGLDGASLIGLDGASLVRQDGRVPIPLAPPGLLSDQGGS